MSRGALTRPDPGALAREAIARGAAQKQAELAPLLKLVGKLRPRVVVEIGTFKGGTLYAWCALAAPDALIVSIDLPGGDFGGGASAEEVEHMRSFARAGQELHFLSADSHERATLEALVRTLDGRPIDLLMIDGDHTYEGVRSDYELYSPLVRAGGLVAFHDVLLHYWRRQEPCPWGNLKVGVHRFWSEVKPRYEHREFCVPGDGTYQWGGIGVLHV